MSRLDARCRDVGRRPDSHERAGRTSALPGCDAPATSTGTVLGFSISQRYSKGNRLMPYPPGFYQGSRDKSTPKPALSGVSPSGCSGHGRAFCRELPCLSGCPHGHEFLPHRKEKPPTETVPVRGNLGIAERGPTCPVLLVPHHTFAAEYCTGVVRPDRTSRLHHSRHGRCQVRSRFVPL